MYKDAFECPKIVPLIYMETDYYIQWLSALNDNMVVERLTRIRESFSIFMVEFQQFIYLENTNGRKFKLKRDIWYKHNNIQIKYKKNHKY